MNEIIFWSGLWPTASYRTMGVYQLAFWLRSNNVNCQVIDYCQWLTSQEIIELTTRFINSKTKYIGISSTFWDNNTMPENIKLSIEEIKKLYPNIKIMIGGPRANMLTWQDYADITIVGEAEDKLLEILKGHNLFEKFDITKLNHRFSKEDCIIDGEVLPIELGRGCIFKCKFCGFSNIGKPKHSYQRSIIEIEKEIIYNYENFNTTNYVFLDDTVNEDIDKVKNLSLIPSNTGININWNGYLRADLIWRHNESADLLIKSGLKSCFFGIETFHPDAARSVGKGWSAVHGKTFLKKLYKEYWGGEINIWNSFIVGLPSEDRDSIMKTLDWCLENPMGSHKFNGLNLYNTRTDTGAKSEFNKNYKDYGYTIDENNIWNNKYFNQQTSDEFADYLNNKLKYSNKLSSWKLFEVLNTGIELKKLKNIPEIYYERLIKNNIKNFIIQYKEKLKSI